MLPLSEPGDPDELCRCLEAAHERWQSLDRLGAVACLERAMRAAEERGLHERAIRLAVAIAELRDSEFAETQDVDVRRFRESG